MTREGYLCVTCLQNSCEVSPLRTLIFLLDMVLPQLDAYHAGRQLQHLQPWVSVELVQQQKHGQRGTQLQVTYQYEAHAGFHVIHLHTEGAPLLLFCAPSEVPEASPKDLCAVGNLGNMEANVMAGRALLGVLQLPNAQQRCAILLVHEKVMPRGHQQEPCTAGNQTHRSEVARAHSSLTTHSSDILWQAFGPVS